MSSSVAPSHSQSGRLPRLRSPRPEALELVADLLLELAGRDAEYPAYTEDQLARKALRSNRLHKLNWSQYTCTYVLLSAELEDLAGSAGLSDDEHAAWRMHMAGYLPEEIAETLGCTRPTVVRLVHSACSRVRSCGTRYRGLYSAYLSLIHRSTYHPAPHVE